MLRTPDIKLLINTVHEAVTQAGASVYVEGQAELVYGLRRVERLRDEGERVGRGVGEALPVVGRKLLRELPPRVGVKRCPVASRQSRGLHHPARNCRNCRNCRAHCQPN